MHKEGAEADAAKAAIEAVVKMNGNVRAVDIDADGTVDVAYVHKGWLFGFIPVSITSQTSINAAAAGSERVMVKLPWWKAFVSGLAGLEVDAEQSIDADATIQANAKVDANAEAHARLVEAIVSSLATVDAKIKASYDLKANTK